MACQPQQTQLISSKGYIYETISKIDQMQKAATVQNLCEGCEGSLISAFYNTKPIIAYLSNGNPLTVNIPEQTTLTPTTVFRIENIKNDAVILRLIDSSTATFTCTNYTIILSIDCICALQCLAPICCDICNSGCSQNTQG